MGEPGSPPGPAGSSEFDKVLRAREIVQRLRRLYGELEEVHPRETSTAASLPGPDGDLAEPGASGEAAEAALLPALRRGPGRTLTLANSIHQSLPRPSEEEGSSDGGLSVRSSSSESKRSLAVDGGGLAGEDLTALDPCSWGSEVARLMRALQTKEEYEQMMHIRWASASSQASWALAAEELEAAEESQTAVASEFGAAADGVALDIENAQLSMITSLGSFLGTIQKTEQAIEARRTQKEEPTKNRFTFENMKAYTPHSQRVESLAGGLHRGEAGSYREEAAAAPPPAPPPARRDRTSDLLQAISVQQSDIAQLSVRSTLLGKRICAYQAARDYLEVSTSGEAPPQEPGEDVKEALQRILGKLTARKLAMSGAQGEQRVGAHFDLPAEDSSGSEAEAVEEGRGPGTGPGRALKDLPALEEEVTLLERRVREHRLWRRIAAERQAAGATAAAAGAGERRGSEDQLAPGARLRQLRQELPRLQAALALLHEERDLFYKYAGMAKRL